MASPSPLTRLHQPWLEHQQDSGIRVEPWNWSIDRDMSIVRVVSGAETNRNHSLSASVGMLFADVLADSGVAPERIAVIVDSMSSGRAQTALLTVLLPNDLPAPVRLAWEPILGERREVTGYRCVGMDASAEATLHDSLAEADAELDAVMAVSSVMVISGKSESGWVDANPGFLEFTGLTLADSGQRTWDNILKREDVARISALLTPPISDEPRLREVECSILRRDGVFRWCLVRIHFPAAPSRLTQGWYAGITEIHQQKWAEQRISRLRDELHSSLSDRQSLLRKIVEAQEEERTRIAAELHDQLGQCITALKMAVSAGIHQEPSIADKAPLLDLLHNTERQIDRLAYSIRPYLLDVSGLHEALFAYLKDWTDQHSIEFELEVGNAFPSRMPPHVEVGLFRIILSALNNVAKHAKASRVSIVLGRNHTSVHAIVEDDGCGFDVEETLRAHPVRARSGTTIMEQRALLLGGTCTWESSRGSGTTIYIRIPLENVQLPQDEEPPCD